MTRHKIEAVRPPRGSVIHLRLAGYQPAAKGRSVGDSAGLCGALLAADPDGRKFVPLADALRWTALQPSDLDPRPAWRWCRHCVGHAVELTGMTSWVLHHVAKGGAS